jgi:hypothetical protein
MHHQPGSKSWHDGKGIGTLVSVVFDEKLSREKGNLRLLIVNFGPRVFLSVPSHE